MNKIHIGIDPGKTGGIAIIDESHNIETFVIPLIGKSVDILKLSSIIKSFKDFRTCHVVLEDVHSIFGSGAKANFSFGHTNGLIEGVLVSHLIPYTKVQPKKWQKEIWEGIPVIRKSGTEKKEGSIDTKVMSLHAVKKMFPALNLLATSRSKVPHDGITDAVCMMEYSRRKFD